MTIQKLNYFTIAGVVILSLLFVSCSGRPDENNAEADLAARIDAESKGALSLINFEQTNAVEQEVFGQESYTIQFKATVRVNEDCFMYVNKSGTGPFFMSFETYHEEPEFIPSLQMQIVSCSKGDEVPFIDKIRYLNTEEGWVKQAEVKLY